MKPRFSICIPNFNYGGYIGETIESVLAQTFTDFEICISDNASTDNSWEVISAYCARDKRIKASRNRFNVGFAGNLDKVTALAEGEWHIMLSSDDLMDRNALELYDRIITRNNNDPYMLVNSGFEQFDNDQPESRFYVGYNKYIWQASTPADAIDEVSVRRDDCGNLLKRGIEKFISPFNFVALCYSGQLYREVNGYESSRMMNPDRWFHWKLCTKAREAVFLDTTLFYYRWHNNNQTAGQIRSGVLKFWMDEYRNCFELSDLHLKRASITRKETENAFFRKVIIGYGYGSLAYGLPLRALRITAFGIFTYPGLFFTNPKSLGLLALMLVYPLTWLLSHISKKVYAR